MAPPGVVDVTVTRQGGRSAVVVETLVDATATQSR
jgi:hypothetical protein